MNQSRDLRSNNELDELLKLKEMYERGDISPEEYESRKAYLFESPDYINYTVEQPNEPSDSFAFEQYRGFLIWGGIAIILIILLLILSSCMISSISRTTQEDILVEENSSPNKNSSNSAASDSATTGSDETESTDTNTDENSSSKSGSSADDEGSSSSSNFENTDEYNAYADLISTFEELNTIVEGRNSYSNSEILSEIEAVQQSIDKISDSLEGLTSSSAESLSLAIEDITSVCTSLTEYYESDDEEKTLEKVLTDLSIANQQLIQASEKILRELSSR